MNHWYFITLSYLCFSLFLLWDFCLSHWQLNRSIRAIKLRLRRKKTS